MRFTVLLFFVLCLVALTMATPAQNKKQTNTCARSCGDDYKPICGKEKTGSKLITFGNECVMGRYNCEHPNGPYEMKQSGECAGNVSVLLS